MKPFDELTSRGRARRLRGMAIKALAHYDLAVKRVRLVTNEFNGIFRVDSASGDKYILRIARPSGGHTRDHFEAETSWLDALNRETEISVPAPVHTRKRNFVISVETAGVPEPRYCMLFSWVPGVDLGDRLSPETATGWGELMASLHLHASTWIPSLDIQILRFDRAFPFPEPVVLFSSDYAHLMPADGSTVFQAGVEWVQSVLDALQASGEKMLVTHGDLHPWNIRVVRKKVSPIDFEDLMWAWPVQDIATALYYIEGREDYPILRHAFQEGYMRVLPWPEINIGEVDAFIAARGLGLLNFVLQDGDPDWQAQASAFSEGTVARVRRLMEQHAP